MKTSRLLLPVALLAGAATLAFAGPPSHLSIRPATTVKAPATKAAVAAPATVTSTPGVAAMANCATCPCCKKSS